MDNVSQQVSRAEKHLGAITVNQQNLKKLIKVNHQNTHKFYSPDPNAVQNLMYFFNHFNMLGLKMNDEIPNTNSTLDDITFPVETYDQDNIFDDMIYSPEYNHNDISAMDMDVTDNSNIGRIIKIISLCEFSTQSYLIHQGNNFFDYQYKFNILNDPSVPEDWYSHGKFDPEFVNSRKFGMEQLTSFAKIIVDDKCEGNSAHLREKVAKPGKMTVTYMKSSSKQKSSNSKTDIKSQEAREKIAASNQNIQNYDTQFSLDEGRKRRKPTKSNLKSILKLNFPISHRTCKNLPTTYEIVLIDAMSYLCKNLSDKVDIKSHTKGFVRRFVSPALNHSRIIVFCFDTQKYVPFIKGQERFERSMLKSSESKIPETARLFERNGSVPLPQFRSTNRQAREDYAKMIFNEMFVHPEEYFSESTDFLILVNGLHITPDDQDSLPAFLHFSSEHNAYEARTAPGIKNKIGQGDDSIFFICDILSLDGHSLCFISEDIDILVKAMLVRTKIKHSALHVNLFSPKSQEYDSFDIDILCRLISNQYRDLKFPIQSFIVLLYDLAYSDYCSSPAGISLQKAIDSFNSNVSHDLVTTVGEDTHLPQDVKDGLCLKEDDIIPDFCELEKEYDNRIFFQCPTLANINLSHNDLRSETIRRKAKSEYHLPSDEGFRQQWLRIVAAYVHTDSLSNKNIIPLDDTVYKLGFCPIDRSLPASLKNTVMNFNKIGKQSAKTCQVKIKSKKSAKFGQVCGRETMKGSETCYAHRNSQPDTQ